jgi:hypothetical protein
MTLSSAALVAWNLQGVEWGCEAQRQDKPGVTMQAGAGQSAGGAAGRRSARWRPHCKSDSSGEPTAVPGRHLATSHQRQQRKPLLAAPPGPQVVAQLAHVLPWPQLAVIHARHHRVRLGHDHLNQVQRALEEGPAVVHLLEHLGAEGRWGVKGEAGVRGRWCAHCVQYAYSRRRLLVRRSACTTAGAVAATGAAELVPLSHTSSLPASMASVSASPMPSHTGRWKRVWVQANTQGIARRPSMPAGRGAGAWVGRRRRCDLQPVLGCSYHRSSLMQ